MLVSVLAYNDSNVAWEDAFLHFALSRIEWSRLVVLFLTISSKK